MWVSAELAFGDFAIKVNDSLLDLLFIRIKAQCFDLDNVQLIL